MSFSRVYESSESVNMLIETISINIVGTKIILLKELRIFTQLFSSNHGCHYPGNMAVRMHKILASPRGW